MYSRRLTALASAAAMLGAVPASANTAAQSLSLSPAVRAGAVTSGENELGSGGWIPIAALVGTVAFAVILFGDDDDEDEPDSP